MVNGTNMREVGWTGGCVPCKSRCCCLPPLFGEEMKVWVHSVKITVHSAQRGNEPGKITSSTSQIWRILLSVWGSTMRSPGDGVVLLGGASEETAGCGFPWPYPWLVLTLMGFTPGDREEPGAHVRTSPSWSGLLPWSHQTHQLQ